MQAIACNRLYMLRDAHGSRTTRHEHPLWRLNQTALGSPMLQLQAQRVCRNGLGDSQHHGRPHTRGHNPHLRRGYLHQEPSHQFPGCGVHHQCLALKKSRVHSMFLDPLFLPYQKAPPRLYPWKFGEQGDIEGRLRNHRAFVASSSRYPWCYHLDGSCKCICRPLRFLWTVNNERGECSAVGSWAV